ncbi:MAG: hypothetical protein P4K93_09570 [Terracidiphilus sp.]|nr:hypothetical protein [Terracidiphilus sp.]
MKRREFLSTASAAAAFCLASPLLRAQDAAPISGTLTIDEFATLAAIPPDFIGLSYESAQLANPAFFSAENTALIALFRELSDQGVLRLGGGTSEFTAFTTEEPPAAAPFDAVGPDTSKNVKSDTPITPGSLRNLRAFLDGTGWRCLYGLNLGRGPISRAAEEAFYAQQILGSSLIAFQLGNEPDAWRNRYRPATWSYADYWKEWSAAHAVIVARVPKAKFAGPDVSNKMPYVTGFAEDVKGSAPDVVMLTSHYYAMGPAGAPGITIDKLLSTDPKLERDLQIAITAAHGVGLPYRMSEGNSCWNGGQPGVSDTLASALWVADMMLDFASLGCAGVNLHGGGNGFYTPIAGTLAEGFTRRPEYFGMEIIKHFAGAELIRSKLDCTNDRVRAYAARNAKSTLAIVINKSNQPAAIHTTLRHAQKQWLLTGPAIDAKQGVTLAESGATALRKGAFQVPAYSAILLET